MSAEMKTINHISNHSPTRGATLLVENTNQLNIFQSTLPRGERLQIN